MLHATNTCSVKIPDELHDDNFSNNILLSEQNDHRSNTFTGGILSAVEYFNRGREREYCHQENSWI